MNKLLKIEYHLVDHCNLNCICCEHFSSISDVYYASPDNIFKDFRRFSHIQGVSKNDVNIYLLGGEPLLHPQINIILEGVRGLFPNYTNVRIRLVTNGLLLNKMQQSFWNCCTNNHIILSITKYPINLDYDQIEHLASSNRVQFEIFHVKITDTMRALPIDIEGRCDPTYSFEHCPIAHRCCYLKGNKIFSCPRIPNINAFNKRYGYNLHVKDYDYIELTDSTTLDDIMCFLNMPNDFCKYCNPDLIKNIPWKCHSNSDNEWIL
ncbi:MAG: radical SAM protein [Bacteroidales bacterium]|nr:radical SAM protein [Bacteroidales bacterium]